MVEVAKAPEPLVLEQATPRYKLFGLIDLAIAVPMLGLYILFYFFTEFTAANWPIDLVSNPAKLMPALKSMSLIPMTIGVILAVRGLFYVFRRST